MINPIQREHASGCTCFCGNQGLLYLTLAEIIYINVAAVLISCQSGCYLFIAAQAKCKDLKLAASYDESR